MQLQLFLEAVSGVGALLTLTVFAAAWPVAGFFWACSVLIGFAWIYLNFFFLMRLMETGMTARTDAADAQKRILVLAVLKFPVIYLAGFFILKSRYFPMGGLLAGLTVFFAALALGRLLPSRPSRSCCQGMPQGEKVPL